MSRGRGSGKLGVSAAAVSLALCSLVAAPRSQAQSFGRLFMTVEQRMELDRIREEFEYGKPAPLAKSETAGGAGEPEPVAMPPVTVNGVVLRSSGNNASWINGSTVLSGQSTPEGIRVESGPVDGAGVRLVLPSGSDTTLIKPGQKIDVVNGKVVDAYQSVAKDPEGRTLFGESPGASTRRPGADGPRTPPAGGSPPAPPGRRARESGS